MTASAGQTPCLGGSESAPLRMMIVAGEASGDALGGRLIRALRSLSSRPIDVIGVGGTSMTKEGLESLFPMEDLTAFGLAEVLPKIPLILRRLNQTASTARGGNLDAMVLIDAPGFNIRLAERLGDRDFPLFQYVAPTVWAWKPKRAGRLARSVDEVLCLFPFEPPLFMQHGLAATDVGHSVVESSAGQGSGPAFRAMHGIERKAPLLCVLPGSRRAEITRLLGVFGAAVDRLAAGKPDLRIVLPTLPWLQEDIQLAVASWPLRPIVIVDEQQKYDAFAAADAAIAASGTVALELAMAGTPHIIAYRVNAMTAWIARRLLTTKYVNLINILFDAPVIPELIQENCTVDALVGSVRPLLDGGQEADEQKRRLIEASRLIGSSSTPPSVRAAKAILNRVELGNRPQMSK